MVPLHTAAASDRPLPGEGLPRWQPRPRLAPCPSAAVLLQHPQPPQAVDGHLTEWVSGFSSIPPLYTRVMALPVPPALLSSAFRRALFHPAVSGRSNASGE